MALFFEALQIWASAGGQVVDFSVDGKAAKVEKGSKGREMTRKGAR